MWETVSSKYWNFSWTVWLKAFFLIINKNIANFCYIKKCFQDFLRDIFTINHFSKARNVFKVIQKTSWQWREYVIVISSCIYFFLLREKIEQTSLLYIVIKYSDIILRSCIFWNINVSTSYSSRNIKTLFDSLILWCYLQVPYKSNN